MLANTTVTLHLPSYALLLPASLLLMNSRQCIVWQEQAGINKQIIKQWSIMSCQDHVFYMWHPSPHDVHDNPDTDKNKQNK